MTPSEHDFTPEQQQALALAAVFQAASLADALARTGECDRAAQQALYAAVMALDANHFRDIFPSPSHLRHGHDLVQRSLNRESDNAVLRPLQYALGLVHLAHQLQKQADITQILRHRLEALDAQRSHFDSLTDSAFSHRLAGIYTDTVGTFRFRIQVKGEPRHLQNSDTVAAIRGVFLAGIRAAFLWRQYGGRRWHLLFRRKRLLRAAKSINFNKLD